MREIKFRAWQPTLKEMWPHEQIEYRAAIVQHNAEALILMQYTGLQDKNGQDIYEGDYIHVEGIAMLSQGYEIVFSKSGFGFYEFADAGDFWPIGNQHPADIEILGNRWINPELINPTSEEG